MHIANILLLMIYIHLSQIANGVGIFAIKMLTLTAKRVQHRLRYDRRKIDLTFHKYHVDHNENKTKGRNRIVPGRINV